MLHYPDKMVAPNATYNTVPGNGRLSNKLYDSNLVPFSCVGPAVGLGRLSFLAACSPSLHLLTFLALHRQRAPGWITWMDAWLKVNLP